MTYIPDWLESSRFSEVERTVFPRLVGLRVDDRNRGVPVATGDLCSSRRLSDGPTRRTRLADAGLKDWCQRRDEEWERLHRLILDYERGRKVA